MLTFYQCSNCAANALCCDRARPCAQCRARGIACVDPRRAQNVFRHDTAFGTTEPRYFLALGYGPWGIGSQRPPDRPDLPGPMNHPYSITHGHPHETLARPEFLDHLAANQGQINLSDFDLTAPGPSLFTPSVAPNLGAIPAVPIVPQAPLTGAGAPSTAGAVPPSAPQIPSPRAGNLTPQGPAVPSIPQNSTPRASPDGPDIFQSPEGPGADILTLSSRTGGYDTAVAGPSRPQGPEQLGPRDISPAEWHISDPSHPGLPQQGARSNVNPAQYFPPFQAPPQGRVFVDLTTIEEDPMDIDIPPILGDVVPQRRSPSPGPVSGPLTHPGLFPKKGFRDRALGTVPTETIEDPQNLELEKVCMDVPPRADSSALQCENESYGRRCADLSHQPPEGRNFYVCDECNDGYRSRIWPGSWHRGEIMAMRAYACATCLYELKKGSNPFAGTGTNVFGKAKQDPDSVAVIADGKTIGGVHGEDLLPLTGCRCGSKLVRGRLCSGHRSTHLIDVKKQTARMSEYRLHQYGRKICPVCMLNNGVDHYGFEGIEGGALQRDVLAYACMICHSYIMSHDEMEKARDKLLDVIPMPQTSEAL